MSKRLLARVLHGLIPVVVLVSLMVILLPAPGRAMASTPGSTPPTVVTLPASTISARQAVLNGNLTSLGNNDIVAVECGGFHSLGLCSNGTLWAWGYNGYGQLGLGDTPYILTPTQVGGATNWVAVSTGGEHCLGLRSDGTLWAWGANWYGQLGLGDDSNRSAPMQVGGATNWIAVSAEGSHSLGLRSDGTLWAWGWNHYGQLGLGDTTDRLIPTQVGSATKWAAVSAGVDQSLALRSDGTLWAWGWNLYGQLGLGDTSNRLTPTQVGSATDWAMISTRGAYSLGLRSDGTLWSWGQNGDGQLGLGDTTNRLTPTQVGSATDWMAVTGESYQSLGLRSDGTLWAWGGNHYGQLGLGDTTDRLIPTQVGSATDWVAIGAADYHSLGLRSDGTLWSWGRNNCGQLGLGDYTDRLNPTQVLNNTSVACQVSFEWGLTTDYGNTTTPQTMTSDGGFSTGISGLTPGTTYHFRAKAMGDGTACGSDMTFTTITLPPGVTTNHPAVGITATSATLNGTLGNLGTALSVQVSFEWGLTTDYRNATTSQIVSSTGVFSADIIGLTPATTYHFRAKATGDGAAYGEDLTFTTSVVPTTPPAVMTTDANDIGATSVTLNGELTSLGSANSVTVSFVWGTTPGGPYANETTGAAQAGSGIFYFDVSGLTPGTNYYYRGKADGDGTSYGPEKRFTTSTPSNQSPTRPSNVSPANAATGMTLTPTLQSSTFSDPDSGDTHAASQWQMTSVSGDYSNPVFDSSADAEHLTQIEILSGVLGYSNTYFWRVKHQDNHATWSEWSAESSFTTLNREPNQPVNALPANGATGVSRTSMLQSSAFSDPDGDAHTASQWQITSISGDYSSSVFDSSADAEYLTQIEVLSGVLGYSSTYYWHVRYQDNHGDWSEWSAETSFTTAAEPQADFWASSVGSSEGFIVVFFTNTSSGGVSPLTCAWDFDNDGTIDSTDWQPWYCYRQPGTYTVNLSVMDASGDADTEVKVNCLAVLSSDGATVETADGQISTEFAAGAVPGVAMVTIKETTASGLSEVPRTFMMGDTCFVISALDDSGNEIVTLSQPSTITVRYSGADVAAAGGDPNSLVLAYWDEAAGQWKTLKTSVDTANLTLSASTAHLCTWAVLAKTTSASDGLPLWLWAVIGLVVVMAAGSGTYLVARRTARSMAGSPAEGA